MTFGDTSWLGGGDWQAKLAERKRLRLGKERKPKAPPVELVNRQDENGARLRAAKQAARERFNRALDAHQELRKFVEVLRKEEPLFKAPIAGVLDVDLVELAFYYGVDKLPEDVRFMAVQEVHEAVRRTNRRDHGHFHDDIPFGCPEPVVFTLEEFKEAMRVR